MLKYKIFGDYYGHDGGLQPIYMFRGSCGILFEVAAFYPSDPLNDSELFSIF